MIFTTISETHRVPIFFKPDALHRHRGFTLLELLMSLTILSILVVIIFGALRIGVRAWEKGEKEVDAHQRHRIVLELMKQHLSSIRLKKIIKEGEAPFVLKGDPKSLEFVSGVSMIPGNTFETVYVKYQVTSEERNKEGLFFFEKNLVRTEPDPDLTELDDQAFHELMPEVSSVAFEYLKGVQEAQNDAWQPRWEPDTDRGLPLAVKIMLQGDTESAPITVIVRLMPEEDT